MTTTKGGIGAVYEFFANGRASYTSAALVEGDYRQDGNQLTFAGQGIGFGWHPDGRLQLNFGNSQLEDYLRQGKMADPGNPLLGEFRGSRQMGGASVPVTLQFKDNNRALFAIYLKTVNGRYQATDSGWSMTIASMPERSITRDPASGYLTITAAGGDSHAFIPL